MKYALSFLLQVLLVNCVYFFRIFKLVKENLHKAFWDILNAELNDDPPEYGQAIRLLEEIREVSI